MTRDDAPGTDGARTESAPPPTSAVEGAIGVARDVIGELAAVVPRLADRTAAQLELTRSIASRVPCLGSWLGATASRSSGGDEDRADTGAPSATVAAGSVLSALARRPGGSDTPSRAPTDTADTAPEDTTPGDTTPGDTTPGNPVPDKPASDHDPSGVGTAPEVDDLPIPEYDSLAASQVVPRLTTLSGTELDAVGAYEASHRGRRTILNRVTQLRAD